MSVVDRNKLKSKDYDSLVKHLERFFEGVGHLNNTIINDAMREVNEFLDVLFKQPTTTTPIPKEETVVVTPTPEQEIHTLPTAFLESLTLKDFNTGGNRTRSTRWGLIKWNVPVHIWSSASSNITTVLYWQNNTWKEQSRVKLSNHSKAIAKVNDLKHSWNAAFVMEYFSSNTYKYYLIRQGHF